MPFFAKKYNAFTRVQGPRVNGRTTHHPETPVTIMLDIQPAGLVDYQRAEVVSGGRRFTSMKKAYGDLTGTVLSIAGEDGKPGDIVVDNEGRRMLVLGRQRRDTFPGSPTAGFKYLLVSEAEHGPGEVTA